METKPFSKLDTFMDFCMECWNQPFCFEDHPELKPLLEEGIQKLLLPACEEGNEDAMFWMAECYDDGWGIAPDRHKAFALRRILAEKGHADQQVFMGDYYLVAELVRYNPRIAFCWYMKAAKHGYCNAQELVADCYYHGTGVKQDYEEAVRWYELAANNPNKEQYDIDHAALQLADCYRRGLGVKKDLKKTAEWFDMAGQHKKAELIRRYGNDVEKQDTEGLFPIAFEDYDEKGEFSCHTNPEDIHHLKYDPNTNDPNFPF